MLKSRRINRNGVTSIHFLDNGSLKDIENVYVRMFSYRSTTTSGFSFHGSLFLEFTQSSSGSTSMLVSPTYVCNEENRCVGELPTDYRYCNH